MAECCPRQMESDMRGSSMEVLRCNLDQNSHHSGVMLQAEMTANNSNNACTCFKSIGTQTGRMLDTSTSSRAVPCVQAAPRALLGSASSSLKSIVLLSSFKSIVLLQALRLHTGRKALNRGPFAAFKPFGPMEPFGPIEPFVLRWPFTFAVPRFGGV